MLRSLRRTGLLVAFFALAASAAWPAPMVVGDVNGDNAVTLNDALSALKFSVKLSSSVPNFAAADVAPVRAGGGFGDGSITISDVIGILRLVVGLDNQGKFTAGQDSPEP